MAGRVVVLQFAEAAVAPPLVEPHALVSGGPRPDHADAQPGDLRLEGVQQARADAPAPVSLLDIEVRQVEPAAVSVVVPLRQAAGAADEPPRVLGHEAVPLVGDDRIAVLDRVPVEAGVHPGELLAGHLPLYHYDRSVHASATLRGQPQWEKAKLCQS